ncbi:virion structural protein [Pseudomonas phage PhiPA3]|uniref:Virion structural protein n=1 Tax=Pseudomonas phage PhiPA3 TaxID=998086 RepID=F8SJW5_BPPA3|nr:virion structural protein [Pseudomonas phage PhiPA3]AEH03510.1 virion structural protein [Pseudomonas phage PhiPA3]
MNMKPTLSMEMLAMGAKSKIGEITEDFIIKVREKERLGVRVDVDTLKKYCEDLKAETGITYSFKLILSDIPDAGVYHKVIFMGHAGTWYYTDPINKVTATSKTAIDMVTEIDLKNVKVKGGAADDLIFEFNVSMGILGEKLGFTVREAAAVMIHEIGHTFNTFMYMGDYVWLNYYLTDGIEILQGKKVNKYKLQILDETWLLENIPEAMREEFVNGRNDDATVRKAILSAWKKAPRHHLTNNPTTAMRREEQMADMFASRLGYGRDLVTGLHKMDRFFGVTGTNFWLGQTISLLFMITFAPLTALAILYADSPDEYNFAARYDNPLERFTKMRRDIIAQMKRGAYPKAEVERDVKAIDECLKDYSKNRSVFTALLEFFRPQLRREAQYTRHEENLEALANNDLFLQAFRLQSKV